MAVRQSRGLVVALASLTSLSGCTALGVSAAGLGGAMLGSSAGAAVKAGTEYELGGSVARTFTLPVSDVRAAALATLERLDFEVEADRAYPDTGPLVARARGRTVRLSFDPITDVLTRVRVTVSRSWLVRDVATAEEILARLESTADATAALALPRARARPRRATPRGPFD